MKLQTLASEALPMTLPELLNRFSTELITKLARDALVRKLTKVLHDQELLHGHDHATLQKYAMTWKPNIQTTDQLAAKIEKEFKAMPAEQRNAVMSALHALLASMP